MTASLMLDMESLSTGAAPVILSLAFVPFDLHGTGPLESLPTLHLYLQMEKQIERGLAVNPDTLLWWFKQSEAARLMQVNAERMRPDSAILAVKGYLAQPELRDADVWAYGAASDPVWLRSLFERFGYADPIHYRKVSCLRTLCKLTGVVPEGHTTAHDAVDDCHAQIRAAQEAWRVSRFDESLAA